MLALAAAEARVVLIGGVALQLQGSSYTTTDIDFAYERTRENAARIAAALAPFSPRPRGWTEGLPFVLDAQTIMSSELLTLETTVGDVDLLGVVKGIGAFSQVEQLADTKYIDDFSIRVLSIEGLIRAKRAAGRPKDRPGLIELEALREAREITRLDPEPAEDDRGT
jgi:hypothetical protein